MKTPPLRTINLAASQLLGTSISVGDENGVGHSGTPNDRSSANLNLSKALLPSVPVTSFDKKEKEGSFEDGLKPKAWLLPKVCLHSISSVSPVHQAYPNASIVGTNLFSVTSSISSQQNISKITQISHGIYSNPTILAASPAVIATSDAAAERAASAAAAARWTTGAKRRAGNQRHDAEECEEKQSEGSKMENSSATQSLANDMPMKHENETAFRTRNSSNNDRESRSGIEASHRKDSKSNNGATNIDENGGGETNVIDNDYPAFTPYHRSLLRKYLTPELWHELRTRKTDFGTTIEDIIRAGVSLPIGANPPRRVGVLVGDDQCYTVFRDLLDPIISEYHGIDNYEDFMDPELPKESYLFKRGSNGVGKSKEGKDISGGGGASLPKAQLTDYDGFGIIKSGGADTDDDDDFLDDDEEFEEKKSSSSSQSKSNTFPSSDANCFEDKPKTKLQRRSTIINNPLLVTDRKADPEGKYIVSTRIRVARSLYGVRFPSTMSRSDRREVQKLIHDCTEKFQLPTLSNGSFTSLLSMTNNQNLDLIERHILFDNPNEWTIASGLGRDWPDGRALYANVTDLQTQTPDFMIWVNEEDHLRIMCLRNGGDIQGVFTTLMNGVRELERELRSRGWQFAYDSRLGYLTSCPTNVGTTMRASVHVRLVNLGRLPGFFELVERLKLEVRGKYGETDRQYTGVFDISNAERLGKSEVHLINVMVEGVAKLIELERRLEAGEIVNCDEVEID